MSNLITAYIEVVNQASTLAVALREMNNALGTRHTHSRIREWERGDRLPTAMAINYMLSIVLPVLLADEGISKKRRLSILGKCLL
ncbi:hypothetical protein [Candidatus Vondammii sp. HM_W22]|uniref:hypothetical protein n=1 Tax=Candidatus Vondammii sp. HM_W22 TaxID=2687299 RepID=UPI001F13565C|nr:hypothetical protein [Candidatus Vondammii sp. HM_W22]